MECDLKGFSYIKHVQHAVRFLLFVALLIMVACSEKAKSQRTILHQQFVNYLTKHVDSTDFRFDNALTLAIEGNCTNWERWRFNIDSIEFLLRDGNIMFKSLNSNSYSAITRTWTPSIPDTHNSMGNSVTIPESLYAFGCKNSLSIDSISFYLGLLGK